MPTHSAFDALTSSVQFPQNCIFSSNSCTFPMATLGPLELLTSSPTMIQSSLMVFQSCVKMTIVLFSTSSYLVQLIILSLYLLKEASSTFEVQSIILCLILRYSSFISVRYLDVLSSRLCSSESSISIVSFTFRRAIISLFRSSNEPYHFSMLLSSTTEDWPQSSRSFMDLSRSLSARLSSSTLLFLVEFLTLLKNYSTGGCWLVYSTGCKLKAGLPLSTMPSVFFCSQLNRQLSQLLRTVLLVLFKTQWRSLGGLLFSIFSTNTTSLSLLLSISLLS